LDSDQWISRFKHPTRDDIVTRVAEALGIDPDDEDALVEEGIILFDGQEYAFLGVAERFENGGHTFFAVYSYQKMIEICQADGMSRGEAVEYLEFNVLGAYVGEQTPAIMHDERE
jgi:hypothetical protein